VRPPSSVFGGLALMLGLGAMLLPLDGPVGFTIRTGILCVSFATLCTVCFCRQDGWLSRSFTWTPLRWLGNISYSYYLLHGLTLKGAFLILGLFLPRSEYGAAFFWSLLPIMFAVSLLPPVVLFLQVERPFSLAISKGGKRREAAIERIPKPLEAAS